MNDLTINEYVEFVRGELNNLKDGKFTGNIEFKVHVKEGGISHMNCCLNKSVKLL